MAYMRQITSPEFRKTYPRLQEAVEVTALGRVIGTWTPAGSSFTVVGGSFTSTGPTTADRSAQQERDAILKRVNRKTGE